MQIKNAKVGVWYIALENRKDTFFKGDHIQKQADGALLFKEDKGWLTPEEAASFQDLKIKLDVGDE